LLRQTAVTARTESKRLFGALANQIGGALSAPPAELNGMTDGAVMARCMAEDAAGLTDDTAAAEMALQAAPPAAGAGLGKGAAV
jgi:hypothetical protein